MKRVTVLLVLALLAAGTLSAYSSTSSGQASAASPKYTVGVFEIESATIISQIVAGFEQGFLSGTGLKRSQVKFDVKNAQGQDNLIETISNYYVSSADNMIAVVGTPCVIALAHVEKKKPIIALNMGDPVSVGVAKSVNKPGGNVTGSSDYVDPGKLLPEVLQLSPKPKSIGTIYDSSSEESQEWVKAMTSAAAHDGVTFDPISVSGTGQIAAAVQSLIGKVGLLWIGPDATATAAMPEIASVAIRNKLPLLTAAGVATQAGVLANVGPSEERIAVLGGEAAAKVYKGRSPGKVAFAQASSLAWTINSTTESQLGENIPSSITHSATIVH